MRRAGRDEYLSDGIPFGLDLAGGSREEPIAVLLVGDRYSYFLKRKVSAARESDGDVYRRVKGGLSEPWTR